MDVAGSDRSGHARQSGEADRADQLDQNVEHDWVDEVRELAELFGVDADDAGPPDAPPGIVVTGVGVVGSTPCVDELVRAMVRVPVEAMRIPVRVVGGATRLVVGTGTACVAGTWSVAGFVIRSCGPWRRDG